MFYYYDFCIINNKTEWYKLLKNNEALSDQEPNHYPCIFKYNHEIEKYRILENEFEFYDFIVEKMRNLKSEFDTCEKIRRLLINSGIKCN